MKTKGIRQFRWIFITIAAAICVAAAGLIIIEVRGQRASGLSNDAERRLVLSDRDTGEQIAEFELGADKSFAVEFIHSVNRSPVRDYYEVREDGIYVVKTVYYGFGAGVQTELEDGEQLTTGEDGEMIISGIEKRISPLIYVVGTVSDHVLYIGEQTTSLRDLCGRNTHVVFEYR